MLTGTKYNIRDSYRYQNKMKLVFAESVRKLYEEKQRLEHKILSFVNEWLRD